MRSPVFPCLLACAALSALCVAAHGADPVPVYPWQEAAWRQAAELQVDDALSHLPDRRKLGSDAERRQLDYTRAVLLLNVQPKLQGNIEQARTLLASVRQTRADDDTGLSALYYLARIAQFHADPGDEAKATALYRELITRAPDHPLAQEAVARLAAMRLFEEVPPEERHTRLDETEAAAARLTLPAARRDAHFVLADALLLFTNDKAGALRHLLAAEEAGIVRRQLDADTTARIAVLARELGRRDVAVAHYRKFAAEYQRDARAYMLGEQLKELEAQPPPAPAATPAAEPPAERVIITGASIPESAAPAPAPSATPLPADPPSAPLTPTPTP